MFPSAFRLEGLRRQHPRKQFCSGDPEVDGWLRTKAFQYQKKHLSATKVLLAPSGAIVGYYTLATGQVDFSDLPPELSKRLPRRALPVAILAWLGVDQRYQGQGLGCSLLARALRDCYDAGETFAFVAVILDCTSDRARSFYEHWDFAPLPGHRYRLFLSEQRLRAMMETT